MRDAVQQTRGIVQYGTQAPAKDAGASTGTRGVLPVRLYAAQNIRTFRNALAGAKRRSEGRGCSLS